MLHGKTLSRIASRKFAITIVFILKDRKTRPPAQHVAGAVAGKPMTLCKFYPPTERGIKAAPTIRQPLNAGPL
jgi:hypothetical protein